MFVSIKHTVVCIICIVCYCVCSIRVSAQWTPCNAPVGGQVNCLDTFNNYLWAGLEDGGAYRSATGGQNWTSTNTGLKSGVKCFLHTPGKLFAGTQTGIYALNTLGTAWDSMAYSGAIYSMALHDTVMFATMYNAVARSTNGGINWQYCNTGLPSVSFAPLKVVASHGYVVVATLSHGLYRSANNGTSWSSLSTPAGVPANLYASVLKVINNRLFAYFGSFGFYYSDDGGTTWQTDISGGTSAINAVDIDISNGQYVIASSSALWTQPVLGGGGVWTFLSSNLDPPYATEQCLFKANYGLYIGMAGEGVMRVDTLLTYYETLNQGLVGSHVYYMAGNNTRFITHVANQRKLWSTANAGQTWSQDSIAYYNAPTLISSSVNGFKWYIGFTDHFANLSINGGQNWRDLSYGLTGPVLSLLATSAGRVIAGSDNGTLFTLANDTTWVVYAQPFPSDVSVTRLAEGGGYMYAAAPGITPHLYRSADSGLNWSIVSSSWGIASEYVDGLVYQGNRVIALTDGYGVFASSDNGNNWTTINTGLPANAQYNDVKLIVGRVYATTLNNVLYSLAAGSNTWVCETCSPTYLKSVETVWANDSMIFAGTTYNGVWKKSLPAYVPQHTAAASTARCFPNPGRTATISWNEPTAATVRLYDIQGRLCETVTTNGTDYTINKPELQSGLYIIELICNEQHFLFKWYKTTE
jgi:photosystem II stability/assembly factor-like uncharacterized protein